MAFDTDNFAKDDDASSAVVDKSNPKNGSRAKLAAAAASGNPAQLAGAAIGAGIKALGSLKKGGHIKKTGLYRLHKGEQVLNKKQAQARKHAGRKKA